ncbi:MAG: hypothetical protein NZV14_04065 [Bryobacteraceae bacterium]|nr:hypothetical protein [Bryobacteraceae bacterium]MDW8377307.1 hypothetical protein [Bryobacterales bacterium]
MRATSCLICLLLSFTGWAPQAAGRGGQPFAVGEATPNQANPLRSIIGRAEYIGGTVAAVPQGAQGVIRTSDPEYLTFLTRQSTLQVLYSRINLLEYGQQVSRRLALAVLLSPVFVLSKKRKHFLTIGFTDDAGQQQALVFHVHKDHIRAILASLEARTGRRVDFQDHEARKAGRG